MLPKNPSRKTNRRRRHSAPSESVEVGLRRDTRSSQRRRGESSEQNEEGGSDVIPFVVPPVDNTVLPRFAAGANQHFNDVVDLSALPPDLQHRLISRAPFVIGLKDAVYDKHFFCDVAGLYASGPHPNEVTEAMMPRSKWAVKWGVDPNSDSIPRVFLKDAETETIRDQYESLYTRVYGNKPDNGSVGNFFLRAGAYYFDKHKPVDWATLALELHGKRFANPDLNPQKLMPPCLTKQVQGLVDEFASTLAGLHMHAPPQAPPQEKNLGPAYLDAFKIHISLAEEDEAHCTNEVYRKKVFVAQEENALVAAKKALENHNKDLELLFQSKRDAEVNGDQAFVKFAFEQIQAVAKTVTDAAQTIKNVEQNLKQAKDDLEVAEMELLPNLTSIKKMRQCRLVDAISEVGLFPQHALPKLSECGAMQSLCPYCCRVYVCNAFVPLSCGCHYHPPCMRALILSGQIRCLRCGAQPHGTWMAYWGFPLDEEMSAQLEEDRDKSKASKDWIEGAPEKVGTSYTEASVTALAQYSPNMGSTSNPSF